MALHNPAADRRRDRNKKKSNLAPPFEKKSKVKKRARKSK